MTHVKHLGFEKELQVARLIEAISWVPETMGLHRYLIEHLRPADVKRAVADYFGIDL